MVFNGGMETATVKRLSLDVSAILQEDANIKDIKTIIDKNLFIKSLPLYAFILYDFLYLKYELSVCKVKFVFKPYITVFARNNFFIP